MSVKYTIYDKEGNALLRNKVDEKIRKLCYLEADSETYSSQFTDLTFISSVSICRNGGFEETTPEAIDKWVKKNMEDDCPYGATTVALVVYLLTHYYTIKIR